MHGSSPDMVPAGGASQGSASRGIPASGYPWNGTMEPHHLLASYARRMGGSREGFYYDSGIPFAGAATFVLVHGLGDEADTWASLFPLLAKGFRLIAPDLPGFGRSVAKRKSNLRSCARLVVDLLKATRAGPAILVGSSFGAVVSQAVAFDRPDLVSGLVLLDGGFPAPGGAPKAVLPMLMPYFGERAYRSLRGMPDEAYASLAPFYADLGSLPDEQRAFLRRRVVERVDSETQLRAYFSLLRSAAIAGAFDSGRFARGLAAFEKPALGLWGENDAIADRASLESFRSLARRFTSRVIAGAGHLPQQEKPETLAALLREFAAECAKV